MFNIGSVLSTTEKRSEAKKALDLLSVELDLVKASGIQDKINYTYKMRSILTIVKACLHSRLGETDDMESCVREAYHLAHEYDHAYAPLEISESIRFYFSKIKVKSRDTTGVGAIQGIDNILNVRLKDNDGKTSKPIKKVLDFWNEVKKNEQGAVAL